MRARCGELLAIFSILMAAGSPMLSPPARGEGIPFGKGLFYPSVDAVWQSENNLFLSQDDPVSAASYAVRPRLRWDLPFRDSLIRFGYSPQVREFFGLGVEDSEGLNGRHYSHFIELGAKLGFSNQSTVDFRWGRIVDTFQTSSFDEGGEVVFNDNRYRRTRFELEAVRPAGARHGVGLHGTYDRLEFDDVGTLVFLDYDRAGGGLVYLYKLGPVSDLKFSIGLETGTQERHAALVSQEREDFERREARVSWQSAFGRGGTVEARAGYLSWDFESSSEDFAGLTGDVRCDLLLGTRTKVSASLSRSALPSSFNVNSYYVTTFLEAKMQRERPGSRLRYFVAGGYRVNDYPEPLMTRQMNGTLSVIGPHREDRTTRTEAGVGYRFNELFLGEVRYRREQRDSNLDGLNFDSDQIIIQVSIGLY